MDIFSIVMGLAGVLGTAFTVLFNAITASRARHADEARAGRENGAMLVEIGYIKSGIESINQKMEKQEKDYVDLVLRLSKAESALRQLSDRLDDHLRNGR